MESFKIIAFTDFPGMNALLGNKPKLLKKVVFSIIDRSFLSNFTWTGKSIKNQTKSALKDFPRMVDVFQSIVGNLDNGYDKTIFLKHLKEKIMKYAYE